MSRPTGISEEQPEFSFGILSDVQYADIDNKQNFEKTAWRYYRQALNHIDKTITKWNQSEHKINLILDLGDLIDGFNNMSNSSHEALAKVDSALKKFKGLGGIHHTWGNHEFYNFSREELRRTCLFSSNSDTSYYHFSSHPKMRIVVLDTYEISMIGENLDSPVYKQAVEILQAHNPNECLLSPDGMDGLKRRYSKINGALSDGQLEWLDSVLGAAEKDGEWVIVMGHMPIYEASSYSFCLLWNYDELLARLHKHPCVKLYLCGHDHDGGYARDDQGLHHLTLRGIVEAPAEEDPTATAHVYQNKLVLHNVGPRVAPIKELVIDI